MASPHASNPSLPSAFASGMRVRVDEDRLSALKLQLGEGEGVTELLQRSASGRLAVVRADEGLLSPPSSPRRRETTFGATLDFVEALCAASSGLNNILGEDRQVVLHKALQRINLEIDKASRKGVAIWFPSFQDHQRVVRLACRESTLLNSRWGAVGWEVGPVLGSSGSSPRAGAGAVWADTALTAAAAAA